jgi:GntR family transcriptional repressor for pyruvate dehydrogenase complex
VIRALDAMGLIDVRHGSGVFVRGDSAFMVASALQTMLQIEKVSILEVLEVRELLGRGSITQAAENATDAEIEELREKLAVLEDPTGLADVQSVIEAIADFQRSISAAAHNPLLLALESVLITLLLHIQITALRAKDAKFWQRRSLEYQHHRRDMVAAIAARRPKRALTAMDAYLEHQRRAFTEDSKLSLIRLSDADAVRTSLDIVSAVRAV